MKKIPNKTIGLILLGILLAGFFYWYEVRPITIIKECNDSAGTLAFSEQNTRGGYQQQEAAYKLYYESCLRKKGYDNN